LAQQTFFASTDLTTRRRLASAAGPGWTHSVMMTDGQPTDRVRPAGGGRLKAAGVTLHVVGLGMT
jgi:hypothetical protein